MMDFDQIVVKESPGLCRCCLSEGCYKDLGTEYAWMSDTEVYADMLLECFDISITQHNEGPNGPNRLICEVCITRLRDACNFKKQVMESEKKFIDMVGRGEFRPKVLIYQGQMKSEEQIDEVADEPEVEYLDDEMTFGDGDITKEEPGESSTYEDVTVSTLPVKGKRGRPRKNVAAANSEKKAKVAKTEEKPRTSKAVAKESNARVQTKRNIISTQEGSSSKINTELSSKDKLLAKRRNVIQLLLKSTIMPFRWLTNSYRCFYCYDIFHEPNDLKSHQKVHKDEDVPRVMKTFWEPVVYVDVSNISCRLCSEQPSDLKQLLDHLVTVHNILFDKNFSDYINQFKLHSTTVECVTCGQSVSTFGNLLAHTKREHSEKSQVLCDICGQNFYSVYQLRHHIKKEHKDNTVKCTLCDEVISSMNKMRTHLQHAHDKKHKCFICAELFETHYKRSRHMMMVHKKRPEFKCQHCSNTFVYRSTMLRHIREMHLQEKNAICKICGWKAFTEARLQTHMTKHSDVRNYKCLVCEKAFKTKKTMLQHYNNIHQKGKVKPVVKTFLSTEKF